MTVTASQGFVLGAGVEASLGAGATYYEIRPDEQPDWPILTKKLIANPNVGHAHPAKRSDYPQAIGNTGEGSLNYRVRRSSSADTAPLWAGWFESMGCSVRTNTATTVAVYTSTTAWTLTGATEAYGTVGDIILPKLEASGNALDEFYYPVLVAAKNEGTEAITPAMALPCATANSEPIDVMTTIRPLSRPQQTGKSVAFEVHTRGDATADGSNDLSFLYKACALGSCGEIKLTPQMPIVIPFNFLLGDIDRQTEEMAVESFVDSQKFTIIDDNFRFEFAAANAAGAIARSDAIMKEATIDLGVTAVPIVGEGSGTVNGRQGYILTFGVPKVTITATYGGEAAHPQFWTQLETPGTYNYIGFVQPTSSLAVPAWAFYAPKCHLATDSAITLINKADSGTVDVTATFEMDVAGFTSTSNDGLWDDEGYSPWYMGVSGQQA